MAVRKSKRQSFLHGIWGQFMNFSCLDGQDVFLFQSSKNHSIADKDSPSLQSSLGFFRSHHLVLQNSSYQKPIIGRQCLLLSSTPPQSLSTSGSIKIQALLYVEDRVPWNFTHLSNFPNGKHTRLQMAHHHSLFWRVNILSSTHGSRWQCKKTNKTRKLQKTKVVHATKQRQTVNQWSQISCHSTRFWAHPWEKKISGSRLHSSAAIVLLKMSCVDDSLIPPTNTTCQQLCHLAALY